MSVHYESLPPSAQYPSAFGISSPAKAMPPDVWPRKEGVFIRRRTFADGELEVQGDAPDVNSMELLAGQFGLVPRWVKSASDAKVRSPKLVNARSETVTTSNNLREAWLAGQRCIVPMMAFFEDDYRTGKAVHTRIARVDGKPMGVAGLWESWTGMEGEVIVSFCLLTVNANSHALLHRYQQPGAEKRMPAVLNEGGYGAWLNAGHPEKAREFLRAYPANWLTANPVAK
jgi:putative SOS response-associated peptidase YedK